MSSRAVLSSPNIVAAGYFLLFASMGSWAPFVGIFYRNLQLSGSQLGILFAIPMLCIILVGPVLGWTTDRLGGHKLVLASAAVLCALAALLISRATTFEALWPRAVLFGLCFAPLMPLMDGIALSVSQRTAIAYGRIRTWGSVGYIAMSFIVGAWLGSAVSNAFFYVQAACLVLTALLVAASFPRIGARLAHTHAPVDRAAILNNKPLRVLLLTQLVLALANTSVLNYVSIFMASMGATPRLIGLAISLMAVSEVPILFSAARLNQLLSPQRMLALAIAIYIVRYVLLSLAPSPLWVLPVQLLNGISFGLFALSAPRLAHELAGGETLAATAQSLLASAAAIGGITGTLITGALLDYIEIHQIFRVMAVVAIGALLIFILGWRRVRR